MAAWYDAFKILTYSLTNDPKSEIERTKNKTGVGISGPDAVPNIRSNDGYFGETGNLKHLKIGTDLIDLSTVSNRSARYKEYERLRSVPEIEQVMTIISDEACISGDEEIETLFYGAKTIKWLAENKKNEEFFVYCWDFEKNDYALGVAYDPRFVKKAMTKKVILDDGTFFIATPDHRVLLSDEQWVQTGDLKYGSTLMPFYRIEPNQKMNEIKNNQFPRIFTHNKGWMHERQFIDEWKTNKDIVKYESINKAIRLLSNGLSIDAVATEMNIEASQLSVMLKNEGFCVKEIRYLAKKEKTRRVIGIIDYKEIDVYDLSVKHFENFCGKSVIFHNCQKDNKKNVLEITCENKEVKKELDFLFLHRKMLNLNRKATNLVKRLCINGDVFWEVIIDLGNPKDGILNVAELAPETMFRIETTKGKLLEFQQSSEGPDYESLIKKPVTQSTDLELSQSKALRFTPEQIIHFKLGDDRKTFYPYGQSLIEPARGPAHQLRLMEDSMIVYRLVRAPERRVFYIDTGNMSGHRQEAFISRMQDLLRKKKIVNRPGDGSTALDERWSSPSADEDYWIPIRPNSQTRIDTLPGATNLGEIDDSVYFRNKLYVALNFPPNYFNNEDPGATRMTLSSQNARVARMIERIQEHVEDGLWQIADLHLRLMGFPEETYEDLVIKLTPPSDWRELARMEIESARINNASSLKGSKIYSDWDILTKVMKHSEKDAQEMISRLKNQFLEEAKIQILMQNPDLLGIGVPDSSEEQMGIDGSGPNPMPTPTDDQSSVDNDQQGLGMNMDKDNSNNAKDNNELMPLEEPSEDDIKKYNLAINNYSKEQDSEEPDYSEF
jgi:hypothetical protein